MKKLSTYLFLILFSFSAPSFADDISDFQIEGISIGDSLLDHFSKKEIEKGSKENYKSNKFVGVQLSLQSYELYEDIQIHYKPNENYIIGSVLGGIFFDNINDCYSKKDEVVADRFKHGQPASTYLESRTMGRGLPQ